MSPQFSWSHWEFHPSVVVGVLALAGLYAWCVIWLCPRLRAPAPSPSRLAAFVSSLLVLLFALNGPLHDLSEQYLFSAHMVQHLLLTLAVPSLMLIGTPGWVPDWVIRQARIEPVARLLTRPLVAFLLPNFVLGVWHFPAPYDAALGHHWLHIVMHLSLMVSAGMLWWPVLSPSATFPRLHYSGQMLYLFALGLPMSLIGALITLAEQPIYQWYVDAPRLFGLSVVQDQRLGGLLMWVPTMLLFWGAMTVVWFRWAGKEADDETVRSEM